MLIIHSGNDQDDESFAPSSITSQSPRMTGSLPNRSAVSVNSSRRAHFEELPASKTIQTPVQNWLARILHVKPAKRLLALQVTKVRAMKEVRGILRDWKRYGMRDIVSDKTAGLIRARVDEENSLHIKPVEIAVEFFTVMHKGRRARLSIARFSQEKGAKSSFEKVIHAMEGVLRGRTMLVLEKKQVREMKKCLAAWEAGQ